MSLSSVKTISHTPPPCCVGAAMANDASSTTIIEERRMFGGDLVSELAILEFVLCVLGCSMEIGQG